MSPSASLDHVTAVLEEIAALARAGVPLEKGLLGLSRDLPRRMRKLTASLGERLQNGQTLDEALSEQAGFPPVFRAVMAAGVSSGQLAPAVEGLVAVSRRLADMRRSVQLAFAYPLSLLLLGYALLIVFVVIVAPPLAEMLRDPGAAAVARESWLADALVTLHETVPYWGAVFPAGFLLAALWSSYTSGRASLLRPSLALRLFGWLPWCRRLVHSATSALACDVLAMLLERGLPLDQALVLAGEASGKPRSEAAARALAQRVRQGQAPEPAECTAAGLPASAARVLCSNYAAPVVLQSLRRSAQAHAQRADDQAGALRLWLPVILVFVVGGGVTLVYAVAIFGPWLAVIQDMINYLMLE